MSTCENLACDVGEHANNAPVFKGSDLLLEAGIKADPRKLEQVATSFDNDPLTLRLLAAYLNRWYAGRLNGLETIPVLYDTKAAGRPLRRVLAAFERKLAGASDMTLLNLLSLSDNPVPQQHMKLVFRSTLLERWLSRRDDYVRFLGPLGRLNEEHWHWVIENLRRLQLLEPPIAGHHDLLLVPEAVRHYFREELRLKHPAVYQQGRADMEKLFKETVVSLYGKQTDRPVISTYMSPALQQQLAEQAAIKQAEVVEPMQPPVSLWDADELDAAQQQLLALRCSLAALRQHSQNLHQQLLAMRTGNLINGSQENNPAIA